MANNPIASGALAGSFLPVDRGACYESAAAPALTAVTKWDIAALTATGVTAYVTGTHTPDQAVIVLNDAAVGKQVNFVTEGEGFNADALTWPAAMDTYAKRLDFAQKTKWTIRKVQLQGNPSWAA